MATAENTSRQSLGQIIKNHEGDHYCAELLRFFGAHPNTRFNRLAVIHTLSENRSNPNIERALTDLTSKGVVKTYTQNETHLYALAADELTHRLVSDLAKLDWHHFHAAIKEETARIGTRSSGEKTA